MSDDEKQLKAIRDHHITLHNEFDWRLRDSKGQSEETMKYYRDKSDFHKGAANFLKALADRHGYRID